VSGHALWRTQPKADKIPETLPNLIAFHRGYILALEDVHRDTSFMISEDQHTLDRVQRSIDRTIAQATQSLNALLDQVGEMGSGDQ